MRVRLAESKALLAERASKRVRVRAQKYRTDLCLFCAGALNTSLQDCRRRTRCAKAAPEAYAAAAPAREARAANPHRSELALAEGARQRAARSKEAARAAEAAADAAELAQWAEEDARLEELRRRAQEVARAVTASVASWRAAARARWELPPAWSPPESEVDPRGEARLVAFQRSANGRR